MKQLIASIRLRALIALISILSIQSTLAQTPHFNHTTIYLVDLQKSADFWEKAMQLKKIPEPFHDNRHVWFKMGEHNQLHVVGGAKEKSAHDINIHLAFSVKSVEEFAKHLDAMNIKYGNWAQDSKAPQVRADGIKQIYLQDPDGYWIEVNDDKF
jgi:lactoylglutathione lyase